MAVFVVSGTLGELVGGPPLPSWFAPMMIALNVAIGGAVVFGLLVLFVRQREEALAELRVEQDRAETLLLNILPARLPTSSRPTTATIADQFAAASILFADIVDFTPLSERLSPTEVVGMLDHLFTHFDTWPSGTGSRRSRRSATATWSRRACRARDDHALRHGGWRSTCATR